MRPIREKKVTLPLQKKRIEALLFEPVEDGFRQRRSLPLFLMWLRKKINIRMVTAERLFR
jgi:hypothetical protein